jgi:hypothetical protein
LFRILDPVLTMAAALTVQSPFVTRGNFDSTVRVSSAFFILLLLDRGLGTGAPRVRFTAR